MSTDHEYDAQQHSHSILDDPDPESLGGDRSPELRGAYPPQFDHQQAPQQGQYYQQPPGLHPGPQPPQQQQMPPHNQYEQGPTMPPTSNPPAPSTNFGVDPNDPMLDADPFGLSASMHYPTSYSFDQQQQQHGQR